jgi:hypothetical protein
MKKQTGLAVLTIFAVFASLFVLTKLQAQGTGVLVVASCGAQSYPVGAVRPWTMTTAGVIC